MPESNMVFSSLFFSIFIKKLIPENKNINKESSKIVFGDLLNAIKITIDIKLSNFLSLKKEISSTKFINSAKDKNTENTKNKEKVNSFIK